MAARFEDQQMVAWMACLIEETSKPGAKKADMERLALTVVEAISLYERASDKVPPGYLWNDLRPLCEWILANAEPMGAKWWAAMVILLSDIPERRKKWRDWIAEQRNNNLKLALIKKGRKR